MKDLILDTSILLTLVLFFACVVEIAFQTDIKKCLKYAMLAFLFIYLFTVLLNIKY